MYTFKHVIVILFNDNAFATNGPSVLLAAQLFYRLPNCFDNHNYYIVPRDLSAFIAIRIADQL